MRAATASATVPGTPPPSALRAASASVTKNGLPAVRWCSVAPSWPVPRARSATADADSGGSRMRCTGTAPRSPRSAPSGWAAPTSSARNVSTSTAGTVSIRRVTWRRTSSVASSTQCTSSTTSTVERPRPSSVTAAVNTGSIASPSRARSSGPPVPRAASRSGPSGRRTRRSSQAPTRVRVPASVPQTNVRTRLVLPIPASPLSSTTQPRPAAAPATAARSADTCASRSSSAPSTPPMVARSNGTRRHVGTGVRLRRPRPSQGKHGYALPIPSRRTAS